MLFNTTFIRLSVCLHPISRRTFSCGATLLNITESKNEIKLNREITLRNNDTNQKKPLLVLFGWGNAKHKQLCKYSELFEKWDFTTVCVQTTLLNSILRTTSAGRRESANVLSVIKDLTISNPDRPIILYPFSNSGCAIYHLLTESMTPDTFPGSNIRAIIFDSCPIIPNEESASTVPKAFAIMTKNPVLHTMLNLMSYPMKLFVRILLYTNEDVRTFMSKMETWPIKSPQMFLFSKTDQLAPYRDIIDFIKKRKDCGVDVTFKLWEDTPHVGHMKKYRNEYESIVESFIKKNI